MEINFSNEPVKKSNHSIFLAGPTLRNEPYEKSWRKEACEKLRELGYDEINERNASEVFDKIAEIQSRKIN